MRTAEDGPNSGTDGAAGTGFLVDVLPLAADGSPRSEVIAGAVQTLDAAGVPVQVVRVPSVQVMARRTPGGWLLVPAGLLIAAGLLGLWRRPAFGAGADRAVARRAHGGDRAGEQSARGDGAGRSDWRTGRTSALPLCNDR